MTKYLVQSGTLHTTVDAESSRKAALWAVHQAMQQVLPVDESDDRSISSKSEAAAGGIQVLDREVRVSELGSQNSVPVTLSTMQIVREWNDMFAALDRLERLLREGGLAA